MKLPFLTVVVLLITGSPQTTGEEPTSHTSFHVPDGLAHNQLHKEGCEDTRTYMVGNFIKSRQDKDTYRIDGADFEVRCLKWKEVVVSEPQTLTLSWTAPTTREDRSPLTLSELQGYRILYYRVEDTTEFNQQVDIAQADASSYVFENLEPGTYYFAMIAIDTRKVESQLSETVSGSLAGS